MLVLKRQASVKDLGLPLFLFTDQTVVLQSQLVRKIGRLDLSF